MPKVKHFWIKLGLLVLIVAGMWIAVFVLGKPAGTATNVGFYP